MKNSLLRASAFMLLTILMLGTACAENMKKIGNLDVHYIALNSTFLTPEIASNYGITRSKVNALINISVLDNSKAGKPALSVGMSGYAQNILGQRLPLEFVEVKEGKAIYYLAELRYDDQEVFQFHIDIMNQGQKETLTFEQKLYVD